MHTRKEQITQVMSCHSGIEFFLKKKENWKRNKTRKEIELSKTQTDLSKCEIKIIVLQHITTYIYLVPPDWWPDTRCELRVSCAGNKPGWRWETIRCHRCCHSRNTTRFVRNTSSLSSHRFLFVQWPYLQATCQESDPSEVKLFYEARYELRAIS